MTDDLTRSFAVFLGRRPRPRHPAIDDRRQRCGAADNADPVAALTSYGILGGVPLYLTFFRPERSLRDNIVNAIVSPSSRLYVEPQAVFAAHHQVSRPSA